MIERRHIAIRIITGGSGVLRVSKYLIQIIVVKQFTGGGSSEGIMTESET
jgi:hypothetical protein